MAQKQTIDAMWDDSPIDVSTEVNFIWSIANKLRGTYQSDKYKDVIIPMVIIRRFECALEPTKDKVVAQFKANPNYPAKAMYRISGFQFYNTSEFTLAELINDADNLAANFKAYLQSFSPNVQEIIVSAEKGLDFYKQIDKMDKNDRLLSVVKAFSELDLNPRTIDKDIKNVVNTAHAIDVPIPYSAQLYEILQTLKIHGHMNDDHGGIVQYFEALADVQVKKKD